MKMRFPIVCCFLAIAVFSACKKDSTRESSVAQPSAPAMPAPAASAPTAPATDASADASAKMAAAEWAMKQNEIKTDPNGQWAIQASASSTYGDAQGVASFSANQATGAPNVDTYGDNGAAWTPKTPDGGIEWLDLKYPKPVHTSEVRIRESCGSGSVIKVEVFDEQGAAHSVWQGNDSTTGLNYFVVKFPTTTFKSDRVKITLATNVVPGWNEIDAVQLVGSDQ